MSDTTAPATPAAPPAAAPPATPPAATPPGPRAPSLSQIKGARRAQSAAAMSMTPTSAAETDAAGGTSSRIVNATPKATEPPPVATGEAPKPETATASIEMDAGALKQFSTLSRELREAKAKAKDLEAKIAGFGKFEKASALAKDGKHYDAAREAGIDVDAAIAELLGKGEGVTATQIDKKLAEEIADLKAFKDETIKEREERKKANSEAAVQQDRAVTGKFVTDNATKYPHLAKAPELVDRVFEDFNASRKSLEAENGPLSSTEQAKLMVSALEVHEEKWAKVFGPVAAPKPADGEPSPGLDASARAGVRETVPPVKKAVTFEELKRERAAKRAAARG